MRNRRNAVRVMVAVIAAAACAIVLDAVVVLAADTVPATTRPTAPSTQPALLGGASISADYARPVVPPNRPPTLTASPNGGSSVNVPATVTVGAGVDPGQGDAAAAAPASSNTSYRAPATTRPAAMPRR